MQFTGEKLENSVEPADMTHGEAWRRTDVQAYRCTDVQKYRGTEVQLYRQMLL